MRKLLIFVADLLGFAIVCVAIENIPWSNVAAYFTGEVTHAASDSLSSALPGRWQVETGELKGSAFTFTESGRFAWAQPADIFGLSDCTTTGTYKIEERRVITMTATDRSASCKAPVTLPQTYQERGDVVDHSHILMGADSLLRER